MAYHVTIDLNSYDIMTCHNHLTHFAAKQRQNLLFMADHHHLSNFIWQTADLLRGPYKPSQYERVILSMTVLRRFDCVLAPTKQNVLAEYANRRPV